MGKYSSGFGPPPNITGVSNHHNRKLNKCIVDVQTVDKNGTVEFVNDAYEQSNILVVYDTVCSPRALERYASHLYGFREQRH